MPRYTDERILKAIEGCRGYVTVIARRLGCRRATISDRLKKNPVLAAAMEEELDKKGDDAEMLLEQMMSEKVPVVRERVVKGKIVMEERMVFSKAATPALIFFLRTKMRHRGYAQDNFGKPYDEKSIDESLREIAEAMMK